MVKLGSVHRPVPFQLVLPIVNHRPVEWIQSQHHQSMAIIYYGTKVPDEIIELPELVVVVHPGLEALLVVVGAVLQGVGSKADEVEVTLHEVKDQAFPANLD